MTSRTGHVGLTRGTAGIDLSIVYQGRSCTSRAFLSSNVIVQRVERCFSSIVNPPANGKAIQAATAGKDMRKIWPEMRLEPRSRENVRRFSVLSMRMMPIVPSRLVGPRAPRQSLRKSHAREQRCRNSMVLWFHEIPLSGGSCAQNRIMDGHPSLPFLQVSYY
jgi:hypothetical protein